MVINNGLIVQFGLSGNIPGNGALLLNLPISYSHIHYIVLAGCCPSLPTVQVYSIAANRQNSSSMYLDWGNADAMDQTFWCTIG